MTKNNYNEKGVFNYDNYISEISHEGERWQPFGGSYYVSDHGRVFSLHTDKLLNPILHKGNSLYYYHIKICDSGKSKIYLLHRLIALVFCENTNPAERTQVHHVDGNPFNNNASNLVWLTPAEHKAIHASMKAGAAA